MGSSLELVGSHDYLFDPISELLFFGHRSLFYLRHW